MSANPSRRVVITGLGVISPLGNSADALWESLLAGRSGVGPLRSVPPDYLPTRYGAEVAGFTGEIDDFGPLDPAVKRTIRKGLKVMCREIQMGVAAAQHALHDAGLAAGGYDADRTGVVYGSDYIMTMPDEFSEGIRHCLNEQQQFEFARWASQGLPKLTPLWLLKYLPNMPASHIAIYNDLRGPNNSLTLREASANLAVGEAYCTIMRGSADTMVAGATGTRIHPLRTIHVALQEELASNGADPARLSRPFDLHRTGMVVGEGAAALVLEDLATAQARGARILAEVVGYGSSTVADRRGVARSDVAVENVLRSSLRVARLEPPQVGHLHAHGLGTHRSDAQEARGIAAVFGPHSVPVVAAKSCFGNLGAGGGMVELIASVLALRNDRLFPVLNYETPDPDCPLRVVTGSDTPAGGSFINLSLTPQGQASAVLVQRAERVGG
ncbi:MAG: beta-ketoacyl-[acyl-carrier-protein] synthase family protein [Pirellulaceae bacterium]|nr:beta-ketoacyl-[acyl-carrier-protein] synthase family protein [Pirellulaceae bacterium]